MPRKNKTDECNQHDRRHERSTDLEVIEATPVDAKSNLTELAEDAILSHKMLGAALYANQIHGQTKSDIVRFLQIARAEKRYIHYGFQSHDKFLDSHLSPMSRSVFHREEALLLKEGPEQYDLFNEWNVPATLRRQLTSGDIVIDGDEIVVAGTERISLTNSGSIKAILEQLVKEKIAAEKSAEKAEAESADHKFQRDHAIEHGKAVQERLTRITEAGPFETALGNLMNAAVHFSHMVKIHLSEDARQIRADGDLHSIAVQFSEIADAYGVAGWQQKLEEIWRKEEQAETKPAKGGRKQK